MSANQKQTTTMAVTPETLRIMREFSERTQIPLLQLMYELAKEIKTILDEIPEESRLVYMPQAVPEKKIVLLRFNSLQVVCGKMLEAKE